MKKEVVEAFFKTYEAAEAKFKTDSSQHDQIVWWGRLLGFAQQFPEAISVFTHGLELFPLSFELFRQRGHRYLSTREFKLAITDLQKAENLIIDLDYWIEPDGEPNFLPIPATSIQFNTHYHLALAYYLEERWSEAIESYLNCLKWLKPNKLDELTAANAWLYHAYRQDNNEVKALDILIHLDDHLDPKNFDEAPAYYNCLLAFKGTKEIDSLLEKPDGDQAAADNDLALTLQISSLATWHLCNGDKKKAKQYFEQVIALEQKSAFGYIVAEKELKKLANSKIPEPV